MSWRTITRADGTVWRERDKQDEPGVVEQVLVSGTAEVYGYSPNGPRIVERGSSAVAAARTRKLRFYPTLPPTSEVKLGFSAAQRIRNEIWRWHRDFEIGGWLLADPRWPDHIVTSTEPGSDASFTRTSGLLGKEVLRELAKSCPHLVVVGSWHLHPMGGDVPSEADRDSWAGNCDLKKVGFDVGIIATPGATGLSDPELSGWITTREGKSHVCERLSLKEV